MFVCGIIRIRTWLLAGQEYKRNSIVGERKRKFIIQEQNNIDH